MKDIKSILKSIKDNPKWLVIIGLCGILLIALSSFIDKSKPTEQNNTQTQSKITARQYKEELESQVKAAICHVTGGRVNVVITLDSDVEYIYASEGKSESSEQKNSGNNAREQKGAGSENNYVIVKDSDGNEAPLVVTAVMPSIKGAVVNCEGADNPATKAQVTQIVTTALNIDETRVCVTGFYE